MACQTSLLALLLSLFVAETRAQLCCYSQPMVEGVELGVYTIHALCLNDTNFHLIHTKKAAYHKTKTMSHTNKIKRQQVKL